MWKIEAHDNYMSPDHGSDERPIQVVDDEGNVVACNTTFYPTQLTVAHAETIVSGVNEVAVLREQLATARAEIALLQDTIEQLGYQHEEAMASARGEL